MQSPNAIYRKTELGNAEVSNRKLGLRAELRRLLILIDGRNTVVKLAAFVRMTEIDGLLQELIAQGLIEPSSGVAPAIAAQTPTDRVMASANAAAAASAPTAAAPMFLAPSHEQFLAARTAAVRFVNDTLGPSGESLAIKLERTHNAQELRVAVTEVRVSIERAIDVAMGQRFLDHVRSAVKL
jgi:hypothetical protein